MLKIACFLTGDNFKMVSQDTPYSKKKVIVLALSMLIPVIIWIINGFLLSHEIMQTPVAVAWISALVCGIMVFLIEKLVIMGKGNGFIGITRVLIGVIVAVLGSIAIDEVIFKDDIDTSVKKLKEDYKNEIKDQSVLAFDNLNDFQNIEQQIIRAQTVYDSAMASAVSETDGSRGTGKFGVGRVAKFKLGQAKIRKGELDELIVKKQDLLLVKDSVVNNAAIQAESNFKENGLLIRIKALFTLVTSDVWMAVIYFLFFALMVFFEMLVVILKRGMDKSNYELKLEMIEEIGRKRLEFMKGTTSPLLDPGVYMAGLEGARNSISKNASLYYNN